MKALNLIFLALVGSIVFVLAMSMLAERLFSHDTAVMVVVPLALLTGLSARRMAEKILGYTLYEAMKE